MKRWRAPKAKPGQLKAQWGSVDGDVPDLCYSWGGSGATKADSHLIHNIFTGMRFGFKGYDDRMPSFLEELKARGYDVTTFKFSIQQAKPACDAAEQEGK